jgi:hypothetical protein
MALVTSACRKPINWSPIAAFALGDRGSQDGGLLLVVIVESGT